MMTGSSSLKSRIIHFIRPTALMAGAVFLTPVLTLYLPLSLAILLPVLVLLAVLSRLSSGLPRFRLHTVSAFIVAAIMVIAAASVGWSYSTDLTWDKLPRTAMIVLMGVVLLAAMSGLAQTHVRSVSRAFLFGLMLCIAVLIIHRIIGEILVRSELMEVSMGNFLNTFNRPLSVLSIMLWPAVVTLMDKRPAYGIAAIAACLGCFATFQTGAATAAVAFGAVVFACVYAAPRVMAPLTGAVLGASILLAPTIQQVLPSPKAMFEELSLPRSAYHRLLVWQFASEKIAERPLLGWGFNSSRAIPGGEANLDVSEPAMPLHPHNAALQWRLELGVLGALLGAGLFTAAAVSAGRRGRSRTAKAAGTATVASTFVIAMLSFGAWQSWWLSGLFVIAAITILACRNPDRVA